jgi:acyl-[acyl-carrier-protein]-phospholipid O-acyltransferase/long-chain-fatty-acid--[acyl-carrier-protein] ligase
MAKDRFSSSFHWLNVTQFLGALNDNVFKLLVIFFMYKVLGFPRESTVALASVLFVVPFLLFAQASGVVADRYSKRNIIVGTKVLELLIMSLGLVAVLLQSSHLFLVLVFLMAAQSTVFGPAKYGIVPELVPTEGLSKANSFLVGLTYLAIILGTFLPSLVVDTLMPGNYVVLCASCIALSAAGLCASVMIGKTQPAGGDRKFSLLFPLELFKTFKSISKDRHLLLAVLGSAYFLFLGGFVHQNILVFVSRCRTWHRYRSAASG